MTTSLVSSPLPLSISAWFNQSCRRDVKSIALQLPSREMLENKVSECDQSNNFPEFDPQLFQQKMLEAVPQGIMVISSKLQLLYRNARASDLCEQLREPQEDSGELPDLIIELCQRFLEKRLVGVSLVMEAQSQTGGVIRSRIQWINFSPDAAPVLLVMMEDCEAILLEHRILEQKKYDLTEREAEVWGLICQHYTYQEISEALRISMNTVKTHVKNVYAKRKNLAGQRKIWYLR